MLDRTCLTEHAWLPVAVARGSGYSWHVSRITDNYNTRRTRTCPTRTTTCKFPQTLSPGSICRPAPFVARLNRQHQRSIGIRQTSSSSTWPRYRLQCVGACDCGCGCGCVRPSPVLGARVYAACVACVACAASAASAACDCARVACHK